MRGYKFRGKDKQYRDFVYGNLIDRGSIKQILTSCDHQVPVEDETVTLFIGLIDINGVEIYEGDILKADGMYPSAVIFKNGSFRLEGGQSSIVDDWEHYNNFEVIGNIFDNSDLNV